MGGLRSFHVRRVESHIIKPLTKLIKLWKQRLNGNDDDNYNYIPNLEEFSAWIPELTLPSELTFIEELPNTLLRLRLTSMDKDIPIDVIQRCSRFQYLETLELHECYLEDENFAKAIDSLG